jgi:hypothetical protein
MNGTGEGIGEKKTNGKLEKQRFQNKMGLAWVSMISIIVFTIALWFFVPEARLKIIAEASAWPYFAFTSIIGAAIGFKTWSDKKI